MGWFLAFLFLMVGGAPIFTWAYRRHLDVLTGPWISGDNPRHD
jgi:hypothetical protein